MRIVFFGSPGAALPSIERLLEAGHRVELVITQPDKPAGRGKEQTPPPVKEAARRHGIPTLQPEKIRKDPEVMVALGKIAPDIIVVVAYGQIIPSAIIDLPHHKSVNVHFSLLPRYRGAAPVQWAILSGEQKTGVTIFELNERMDEGDILSQLETDIGPRESARELEERLSRLGADLLVKTLEEIDELPHLPQDQARATLAPRLHKDQGRIDWGKDATSIDRMVRAFSPWPGAFTFLRGQRVIVHAGSPLAVPAQTPEPGRIVEVRREGPVVGCGGGSAYLIERLQRENRKEMAASDFLRGTRVETGDCLG
ncbi:MAG: methionyl-tRNA formyltransferase [Candidatus Aminicenantes bacterium RBG_19FT_COMBO_58_17]|nr:MAG: methionyl-tRNA formyltransferase [Candidatus Aminicenantes bacterium RBG_19FT_COMBO_58_17]